MHGYLQHCNKADQLYLTPNLIKLQGQNELCTYIYVNITQGLLAFNGNLTRSMAAV